MTSNSILVKQTYPTATVKKRTVIQRGKKQVGFFVTTSNGNTLGIGKTKTQAWNKAMEYV